ncbi:hypothetical protein LSTR_LSTR004103 [Laodelphax striatellus]|uniref:Uncharacterized protein n=1 Tax=Laodelphax striatellus TaxID=195883 RepID=A0A482WGL5_LAOST|nr:hypothetical protein LSTR_LSTR004103 [Laodelphax striatellus]
MGKSLCGKLGASTEHCEDNLQSIIVALIFIGSQILNGLGCSTYWSLGFTYLDDNVRKDKVALLIGKGSRFPWVRPKPKVKVRGLAKPNRTG